MAIEQFGEGIAPSMDEVADREAVLLFQVSRSD